MSGVAARYEALVASGALEGDRAQRGAIAQLDGLIKRLERPAAAPPGLFARLFGGGGEGAPPVKGLYIWGDVGRGKTMLMDLFFATLPVERKRRVHFHAFMAEIHDRVHVFREQLKRGEVRGDDPIAPVAADVAAETRVLCFDEFAVTDIADAMILGRLFTQLFARGVVVVATSNVAPEDLYKDGLQRQNFLPFLDLLVQKSDVVRLDARTDFRLEKLGNRPVWHVPNGPEADRAMDADWARLSGGSDARETIAVHGRTLVVPRAALGAARFTFAALCESPLGASDYLALARAYHTLALDRIPVMELADRNAARRFITLIDTLYDHGVKLVASAATTPAGLYRAEQGKEAFEFRRTVSRLIEMRSQDYLAEPHRIRGEGAFVPIET